MIRSLEDDAELLALGREFDATTAAIDAASDDVSSPPTAMAALLERLTLLDAAIVAAPARTIEGFCVTAGRPRSAHGARMALSIIRDLVRLYNPSLERPGALANLLSMTNEQEWRERLDDQEHADRLGRNDRRHRA